MALNIKNQAVENLLDDVIRLTGETKTEAVRKALEERRQRLQLGAAVKRGEGRLLHFLQQEIWPLIPAEQKGQRLSKDQEEALLGYGESGV